MRQAITDAEVFNSRQVFSPKNLTVARQWRGYTMKDLAADLEVSQQTVTSYEKGLTRPADVEKIADTLRFPIGFFYAAEIEAINEAEITFRARRSLTLAVKSKAVGRCNVAHSLLTPAFRKRFRLPGLDLPDLPTGISPELAARELRQHWQLGHGPIHNMVHLLEAKGIDVYWLSEDSPCVSAFSFCREKKPYVFINGGNGSGERGRHSAAHELGHLVLHRNVDKLKHDKEAEADEFASAFLMPLEQFTAESPPTPILDSLLRLKKRWGTSVASMVVRNHKIGKYGQWYYENAFKEISRRGWRLQEPEEIPMEHSAIHELAYNSMNERGETPAHFAAQLNLHLEDLTELTPIARNYIGRRKHLRLVLSESK